MDFDNRPTLEEILTTLRAMLPELQAQFGIRRIGVYGAHVAQSAWHTQTGQYIELLAECAAPLGSDFTDFQQLLAERLHWQVQVKTPGMLPKIQLMSILERAVFA